MGNFTWIEVVLKFLDQGDAKAHEKPIGEWARSIKHKRLEEVEASKDLKHVQDQTTFVVV